MTSRDSEIEGEMRAPLQRHPISLRLCNDPIRLRHSPSPAGPGSALALTRAVARLTALYYFGLSALFTHELDAVMHSEWRLLYFLRSLPDEAAYTAFVALHLPAFAAFFWLSHHPGSQRWFRLLASVFLVVHAGLHFRSSGTPGYGFEGWLSNSLIFLAAAFGLAYVLLYVRLERCRRRRLGRFGAKSEGSGAMAGIPDVTDESFEDEVLQSDVPVLVDFWGDHCPACRQISPVLRELAAERPDTLKVVKVHAAENAATSARYGVRAMPTVLVFSDGAVRGQLVGARPKSAFVDLLEQSR